MTLAELKALKNKLFGEAEAIEAKAKAENRDLTDAETETLVAKLDEIEKTKADIESAEKKAAVADRMNKTRAAQSKPVPPRSVQPGPVQAAEPPVTERALVESVHANLLDDPKFGFKSMGEFATAVRGDGKNMPIADHRLLELMGATTGSNETIDSDGGFIVPPEMSMQIWDGTNRGVSSLVQYCDVYRPTGKTISFNANAETSRANGSRYGGIRAYWLAEGAQGTNAHPKVRRLTLEPKKLMALVPVTEELLEDSGNVITDYITRAASEELTFVLNDAIVNGTGAGQPKGFLNSASTVSIAKETGQTAATIVYNNIIKMYARMHIRGMTNFRWFINQDTIPQLSVMSIPVGTGGALVWQPPNGAADSPNGTIMGRPVVPTEWNATIGTTGDIVAADLSYYALALRGGVRSAVSMHLRFDYDEQVFKFAMRADGQPWLASPITPFKGSANTVSPIVKLDTRA